MKLPYKQFLKMKEYLFNNARELEKQLFYYFFENRSKEAVYNELKKYQNEDGGFGHGLEPDFLLPSSSPMATSVAFQILSDLKTPKDHVLVEQGIRYFLKTYNADLKVWESYPQEVNNYPHTPWWHYRNGKSMVIDNFANPTPEIIGYLWEYMTLVPLEMINSVTDMAIERLNTYRNDIEMHGMICYQRLSERIKDEKSSIIKSALKEFFDKNLEVNPSKWQEYVPTPIMFVESKESMAYSLISKELIDKNLDYIIKQTTWDANWPKEAYDIDHWNKASKEWRGIITLRNLRILKAFNRIEGL